MLNAARKGFINATDVADYLTKKGEPFRSAYKISGQLVAFCIAHGKVLEELELSDYREFSPLFDESIYGAIDLSVCVEKRVSEGGTSVSSVKKQIAQMREFLKSGNKYSLTAVRAQPGFGFSSAFPPAPTLRFSPCRRNNARTPLRAHAR